MCIQYNIQVRSQKKLKVHDKWGKNPQNHIISNMTNSQNYSEITNTLLLH